MADSASQCNKVSDVGYEPNVTRRSPIFSIATPDSKCDANMKAKENFNESQCDSDIDIDSESTATTSSLESSITDSGLDRKFDALSMNYILDEHFTETFVKSSGKRSSKGVKMKSNEFDLRSVLSSSSSPKDLDFASVETHKLKSSKRKFDMIQNYDDFDLRSVLGESSSQQACYENVYDFRFISYDKVCQEGHKLLNNRSQYDHVETKNDLRYDCDFDLRSMLSESTSSKPTYENLDFDSGNKANDRTSGNLTQNVRYDHDFDLRTMLSESSVPKPTSDNVLDFDAGVGSYKQNMMGHKAYYRPPCDPIKNDHYYYFDLRSTLNESSSSKSTSENLLDFGSNKKAKDRSSVNLIETDYYDHDFDLRSMLCESSLSKPASENVLDFDSRTGNYEENVNGRKAYYRLPCNSTRNSHCDSEFDLRSTLSESPSPKSTSDSLLDFNTGKKPKDRSPGNRTQNNCYDHDFGLRSMLSESSSSKPASENVLGLDSGVGNYKHNMMGHKAYYRPPCNSTKNGYCDPEYDLRSTLCESSSSKSTSESSVDFELEINNKLESKEANNPPRSNSTFDLRYVLDSRQINVTSDDCGMRQRIILQSQYKHFQMHRDTSKRCFPPRRGYFSQASKKTIKRREQKRRSLQRKPFEGVIVDDIFEPVEQELTSEDDIIITEFLRKMRKESDERQKSEPVVKTF